MSDEDVYRGRAEALLKLAAGADNMKERSRLIDEAMHWHNLALSAHAPESAVSYDDESWMDDIGESDARGG